MTKKNIFVYKLFFSANISDFIFYVTIEIPPPPPPQKWGSCPPPLFENLVEGPTPPPPPPATERGVHTMQTLLSIIKHNRTISRFLTATFK